MLSCFISLCYAGKQLLIHYSVFSDHNNQVVFVIEWSLGENVNVNASFRFYDRLSVTVRSFSHRSCIVHKYANTHSHRFYARAHLIGRRDCTANYEYFVHHV